MCPREVHLPSASSSGAPRRRVHLLLGCRMSFARLLSTNAPRLALWAPSLGAAVSRSFWIDTMTLCTQFWSKRAVSKTHTYYESAFEN